MLHEFLNLNRDELISRCRAKVALRHSPRANEAELEYCIPVFLAQLIEILREESGASNPETPSGPPRSDEPPQGRAIAAGIHGKHLLRRGFSVDHVVRDYGDLCQTVFELAIERRALITNREFQTFDRCLDNAIADAVAEFARERERVIDHESGQSINQRLASLASEFRSLLNTTMLALDATKHGSVGPSGSTGALLDQSVKGLLNLYSRSLVDVRLMAGIEEYREPVLVSDFIEEIQICAAIHAKDSGLQLIVPDVEQGLTVQIDRQIMAGAVANLLQNAFKFTKPHGRVLLKAFSWADHVLIDVEDECGGLPPGNVEDLFQVFGQRRGDRTRGGRGLGISRRGVEANGGKLRVRNFPGTGCVFTIDLPKVAAEILQRRA